MVLHQCYTDTFSLLTWILLLSQGFFFSVFIVNKNFAVRAKPGQQHNQTCCGSSYVSLLLCSASQPALILRGSPRLCALLCQGQHRQAVEVWPHLQASIYSHLPFGFECWSQCFGTSTFFLKAQNFHFFSCLALFWFCQFWYVCTFLVLGSISRRRVTELIVIKVHTDFWI